MPIRFGETLTVLARTRAGQDADGNDVWSTVSTDIRHCAVWRGQATELVQGQDMNVDGRLALLPVGTAIAVTDQVQRADGTLWEVDGQPALWNSPLTGWKGGVQIALRRVTG